MNERTIFLVDGLGAMLSFISSGIILPHFADVFGLPKNLFYFLAVFPAAYMIFSLSCYRFAAVIKSWMLLSIICANLGYCLLSAILIASQDSLSEVGMYLLIAEILIVLVLVSFEVRIYQKFLRS